MVNPFSTHSLKLCIPVIALCLLVSCKQGTVSFTTNDTSSVKDSVVNLANQTSKALVAKGPVAWLNYFEDSPDFFMASDGGMAFPNYSAADSFIKTTLVHQLKKIDLKWSDIRVDPISSDYAAMGAGFHEDLTDFSGKVMAFDGYFTATVHQTSKGWKYRNMHWSIKKGK